MKEILTINELREAIDRDSNNHRIKDLAELLWTAMNDWPTQNQINIRDFIVELYHYYGFPLTIDRINQKVLDVSDDISVWKHEAGSSIAEIIDISTRFENESDFEKILNRLLNYELLKDL
jgi:hypothetical protein